MGDSVVDALRAELGGVVYQPGDDRYRAATDPGNSSYPQRPVAVVCPAVADDVARAVAVAGKSNGRIVIQATGHGAGAPVNQTEVLLDTSGLDAVDVDPGSRVARVGAGATWRVVQEAAAPHGLLGLSGTSPNVGVAGYTFSGGVGWFVRKYGLASTALRAVDYVDGTGQLRRAADDATESLDREALWAFRGGAPVGIATSIDIDLIAVPELSTGYLLWPAEALGEIAAAWGAATAAADSSVSSVLALLRLPPEGPFPDQLLGTKVVHLSYASPDGRDPLESVREAVRKTATPVVDTTGAGDVASLTSIHLDPPAAVPARGRGRWLDTRATDVLVEMFGAARVGEPDGLNMIEVRHTDSAAVGSYGAATAVPAPFLVHAVGAAGDDRARSVVDERLEAVHDAGRIADTGRSAPTFGDGQADPGDVLSPADLERLRSLRDALDPAGLINFHRHPVSGLGNA